MHHSVTRVAPARMLLVATTLVFSCLSPVHAAEPTQSIMMPKAGKSLLLDAQQQGDALYVVGERGHILKSTDNGNTWRQAQVPVAQMLTAVHFVNDQLGWAAGHDGHIVHTADGGQTWVLQRDGLKAQAVLNEQRLKAARAELKRLQILQRRERQGEDVTAELANGLYVNGFDSDEPLSVDEQLEEAGWQVSSAQERLQGPVIAPPLMDIRFADEQHGWASGAFGSLLSTNDGGKTWLDRSADVGNASNYHLNAIVAFADGTVVIGGEAGFLAYSHDGGASFNVAELDSEATIFDLIATDDGSVIVATGLRGTTFRSRDRGQSWQELSPGVDYSLAGGAMRGDNLVLAGAGGSIAISDDGGDSFRQHILPTRSSLSQAVVIGDNQFLLVGQGGIHRFDASASTAK